MKMNKLKINTKTQSYNIIIGSNLISSFQKILFDNKINFEKCLIIVDNNVPKQLLKKLTNNLNKKKIIYFYDSSEFNKSQLQLNKILELLLKNNFHRNDCVISVGGGITGDLSGFAASIYKRGLKFINVPTTLLAQVDSSIGGKTGINSFYGKNLIGSFYQPSLVISDTHFLNFLPKREIICGYAEILKHSLIADKKFFMFLNKHGNQILKLEKKYLEAAIYKSCNIKKKVVELDEKENNLRKTLNFGHTFAHAYEASMKYSKKLNHGEAVLLGMISASNFAFQNSLLSKNDFNLILEHYLNLNLIRNIKSYFSKNNINVILKYMQKDKKNSNDKINLILLKKIGQSKINLYFSLKKLTKFLTNQLG